MEEDKNIETVEELSAEYDSPEAVEKGVAVIDEKLWEKVARVGKKISFGKDLMALYRYITDPTVKWYRKSIVVAALIYFITPVDAIPDLAPFVGYLDDLGVIAAVLKYLGHELTPYYED